MSWKLGTDYQAYRPGWGVSPAGGPPQGGLGMMPVGTFFGDNLSDLLPQGGVPSRVPRMAFGGEDPRMFPMISVRPIGEQPPGGVGGLGTIVGGAMGPDMFQWPLSYGRRKSRRRGSRRRSRRDRKKKSRSRR